MTPKDIEDLESLKPLEEQYSYKTSVNFEGNEDVEPFYGHVVGFSKSDDSTVIFVILRDEKGNEHYIEWSELEDCEFDFDEYITEKPKVMEKLRVWHMPQVPCKSFYVEVDTVEEAVLLLNALANYDLFQFENKIKPDYSNAQGLQLFDKDTSEWEDWCINDTSLGYFDDPEEYLEAINENKEKLKGNKND